MSAPLVAGLGETYVHRIGRWSGCENFPVGSKGNRSKYRDSAPKKRWWYKVTENPMVVVFFTNSVPTKTQVLSEEKVTVHPFVQCANRPQFH